jgi:hypothetical protein
MTEQPTFAPGTRWHEAAGTSMLVLLVAIWAGGCGPDSPAPAGPSQPDAQLSGTRSRLDALAVTAPTAPVEIQVEFTTRQPAKVLVERLQRQRLNVIGFHHAFIFGDEVQVGGFELPSAASPTEALREYLLSTGEFLRTSTRLTALAMKSEARASERQAYSTLLAAFKARLAEFEASGPRVYSVRIGGEAQRVAEFARRESQIKQVRLREGTSGFLAPAFSSDVVTVWNRRAAIDAGSISPQALPCQVNCTPPPPPPPPKAVIPIYDAYNDETFLDDTSVDNSYWAPSEGKSWVDQDASSRYTYNHWLWKFPRLRGPKANPGRFSIELEVHQTTRKLRTIYGKDFYIDSRRAWRWDSNLPAPYLDTQATDPSDIENHAVGTNRPEDVQYNTFYYTWIRFSNANPSSTGDIQIATALGPKTSESCTLSPWCTLSSLRIVRVLPWFCGYRAPNSLFNFNVWRRWGYDGVGYKNEQCREFPL